MCMPSISLRRTKSLIFFSNLLCYHHRGGLSFGLPSHSCYLRPLTTLSLNNRIMVSTRRKRSETAAVLAVAPTTVSPDHNDDQGSRQRRSRPSKKAKKTTDETAVTTSKKRAIKKTRKSPGKKPPSAPKKKPPKTYYASSDPNESSDGPLLNLRETDDLIPVTMVQRPSKRNRSPYVGDVRLDSDSREAICHLPNLDMGGKCIAGTQLLVKPARDRKGELVGPDAVSPQYGTPKCEFIGQLLCVDETKLGYTPPVWVGAHPRLGELIAEQLLARNRLSPDLPQIASFQREVPNIAGSEMRADFLIHFAQDEQEQHKPCVLEVKTVVDTDYAPDRLPTDSRLKCVFVGADTKRQPNQRAAIFPWGQSKQKGPDGEKVVSERAIKHVHELTRLATGELKDSDGTEYQAAVLFVVIRKDAVIFRPNHEACPSFCKYLERAKNAGVHVLAKRVDWGDTDATLGQCTEGPLLDIAWPMKL